MATYRVTYPCRANARRSTLVQPVRRRPCVGIFEHAKGKLLESKDLEIQAKANSKEQYAASPEFERVLIDSLVSALDNYQSMGNRLLNDSNAGPCSHVG